MGMLDKLETKRRTQPATGPVNANLPMTPWLVGTAIPLASLLRDVVFKHGMAGMSSQIRRGSAPALATLFFEPSRPTRMRVESKDFKVWEFALGAKTIKGWAYDWELRLTIQDGQATVETLRWLTTDGKLAKGDFHDTFRQELLNAVATGAVEGLDAEANVSAASLALPILFAAPAVERAEVPFEFVTSLARDQLVKRMTTLGFRLRLDGDEMRWSLGLPADDQRDFAVAKVGPNGVKGVAHITSTDPASRRVAEQGLRVFLDLGSTLIRLDDEQVRVVAPDEWLA